MDEQSNINIEFFHSREFQKDNYLEKLSVCLKDETLKDKQQALESISRDIKNDTFILNDQEMSFIEKNPGRWIEYLIFRYNFRALNNKYDPKQFPVYLLIEPTSMCNLKCVMCFQRSDFFTKRENRGFIDFEFFKSLIDQAVENHVGAVTLASRGEPLLHKDIGQMIDYMAGKFFETKINTNGMLLSEELSHKILKGNINHLTFSIDTDNAEEYEKIRVKGDFKRVLNNIIRFREIKNEHYPNALTEMRVTGVQLKDSMDLESFDQFWSQYVDKVAYKKYIDREDTYNNKDTNIETPCRAFWNKMYIWWDGKCNPCDYDFESRLSYGNAKEKSLKEIWFDKDIQRLRKAHLNKRRKDVYPCNVCSLY